MVSCTHFRFTPRQRNGKVTDSGTGKNGTPTTTAGNARKSFFVGYWSAVAGVEIKTSRNTDAFDGRLSFGFADRLDQS